MVRSLIQLARLPPQWFCDNPGVAEREERATRMTRRERRFAAAFSVFVVVLGVATVTGLAQRSDPEAGIAAEVFAGVSLIAAMTGVGAYVLLTHAIVSSREEQARHDELEERAREEGRRRRAAEAAARAEAERKAREAAARKPPPPAPG